MAKNILPESPPVTADPSRVRYNETTDLVQDTIRWLREVFEIPPDAILLPGSGGSLGCPIARTLSAWGLKGVFVMETRLSYSEPGGEKRTVLFNSRVKRFIASFDKGWIPELLDRSLGPVVYETI